MLGRYDARFSGFRYEPGTDGMGDQEYDPSDEAVTGPLGAAFNDYIRRELHFESDIPYELSVDVDPWNFGDAANGFPNTAENLRKAMTRNPYLKVWVTCSYYDLATPFFGAENVIASMNLEPAIRANLRFSYYESGHMLRSFPQRRHPQAARPQRRARGWISPQRACLLPKEDR
jgi:carboxypeptidase C (cathepsin A)